MSWQPALTLFSQTSVTNDNSCDTSSNTKEEISWTQLCIKWEVAKVSTAISLQIWTSNSGHKENLIHHLISTITDFLLIWLFNNWSQEKSVLLTAPKTGDKQSATFRFRHYKGQLRPFPVFCTTRGSFDQFFHLYLHQNRGLMDKLQDYIFIRFFLQEERAIITGEIRQNVRRYLRSG